MLTSERPAPADSPAAPAASPRRRPGPEHLLVAGLTAAAVGLRVPTIGRAYWIDEAISVGIASHPLHDLPGLLRHDGAPPLWYVLLHFWMELAGDSPVATHTLSLAVSVLVVPLAWWSGRRLFGRPAGLAAAALAATNPFLAWYGTENRMYTLVLALALVALTCTVEAVRSRSVRWTVGAVVAFAAACWTHNWALYLTTATAVVLLARAAHTRDRSLAAGTIVAGAAVLVLYLPWLPSLLHQAGATAAPWAVPPGIGDLFADPSTALGGTIGFLVAPALAAGAVWTHRSRPPEVRRIASFLVAVTLVTTVGGWLLAHLEPSWTIRYLAVTIPGWLLAAAGALGGSTAGRRVVVVVCAGLAAWSIVGSVLPDANPADAKDNVAAVASAVAPAMAPGDMVVVTQTEQVPVVDYYLPSGLAYYDPMGRVADPSVVNWTDIIARLGAADACRSIEPAIAALPVGAKVLEIDPLDPIGASGSAWSIDAHRQVVAIDTMLGHEPSLRPVRSLTEATSPKPYSPVIGELFVKVAGPTTCR